MINEYDTVQLLTPIENIPIDVGLKGVVLVVYPGNPMACEIEFFEPNGRSLGCYTVEAKFVDPII